MYFRFIPEQLDSFCLRQITTIFAFIIFRATIWLLNQFNLSDTGFQFSEYLPWSDFIGLRYSLAVDGLS